jgi:multiple sugar transport system substrate-binding protein
MSQWPALHSYPPRARRRRALAPAAALAAAALGLAACGSSGGSSKAVSASAKQTIVFAESGLGTEGQQTQTAINGFEKANPSIKVKIDVLSSNSTTYLSQLENSFTAGSPTPDVFESDVTYPAKFAQAGWVLNLTKLHPDMSQFLAEGGPGVRGRQVRGRDHRVPDRRLRVRRQAGPLERQHAG